MEFSQEVVSIGVIVAVCVSLSLFCVVLWFCRCRRDQIRHMEEKHERQVEMHNFQHDKKNGANIGKAAPKTMKGGQTKKDDAVNKDVEKAVESKESDVRPGETMGQYESRMSEGVRGSALERIKEDDREILAGRHKRLDTISDIAVSTDSLQRNDSKTNVFNVEAMRRHDDVDLNPGLNNSINLETI